MRVWDESEVIITSYIIGRGNIFGSVCVCVSVSVLQAKQLNLRT